MDAWAALVPTGASGNPHASIQSVHAYSEGKEDTGQVRRGERTPHRTGERPRGQIHPPRRSSRKEATAHPRGRGESIQVHMQAWLTPTATGETSIRRPASKHLTTQAPGILGTPGHREESGAQGRADPTRTKPCRTGRNNVKPTPRPTRQSQGSTRAEGETLNTGMEKGPQGETRSPGGIHKPYSDPATLGRPVPSNSACPI